VSLIKAARNEWAYFKMMAFTLRSFSLSFVQWAQGQLLLSWQRVPMYKEPCTRQQKDLLHSGKWQNSVFK